MTDQQHPITPPPELVQQWVDAWLDAKVKHLELYEFLATQGSRWGADQELEACCEWLGQNCGRWELPAALRAARRPKPQSLKEQALEVLNAWCEERHGPGESILCDGLHVSTIRRALEQLDD